MENLFLKLPVTYEVSGIYLLKIKEHLYVGSSKYIKGRLSDHRKVLKNDHHYNQFIQRAYNKYKECKCCILEICDQSILLDRELHWITTLSPDMNLIQDPTLVNTTCLYNQESASKVIYQYSLDGKYIAKYPSVSEAARQLGVYVPRKRTGGTIAKCARDKCKGIHKSAYGYLWSYEKLPNLERYINKSKDAKSVLIEIKDIITNKILTFKSIADAVRSIGTFHYTFAGACAYISSVCRGKSKLYVKRYECKYI